MSADPLDFLALEPLLMDHLRAALPPQVHVLAVADLADVSWKMQPTPAVHVLYRGHRPTREKTGMFEEIDQVWWTVVVVHNARGLRDGRAARQTAGPLLGQLVQALGPWVPPLSGYGSFALAEAPAAQYEDGFGFFPLAWRVHARLRVAPARKP